jgi:hypothetical protein
VKSDSFGADTSTVCTPCHCPFSSLIRTLLQIHPATVINQMLLSRVSAAT